MQAETSAIRLVDAPFDLRTAGPVKAAAVLWRFRGQLIATVVVKATFAFAQDKPMTLVEPEDIVADDIHFDGDPSRSVRKASDLAPYRAKADVLLIGHATAPQDEPSTVVPVRLAVHRDDVVLDKSIVVAGDRAAGVTELFTSIPLVYERAYGGRSSAENPVGTGASGGASPNLVHPGNPRQTAGFGPIARSWPARASLLGASGAAALRAKVADYAADFRWDYFQSAPIDQRVSFLRGDEWILIEGVHPTIRSLRTQLPKARGVGRVKGALDQAAHGDTLGRPLVLNADTLVIDADTQHCSVTFRAGIPVASEEDLKQLRVVVGVEVNGKAIAFPPLDAVATDEEAPSSESPTIMRDVDEEPPSEAPTIARDIDKGVTDFEGTLMLSAAQQQHTKAAATTANFLPFAPHAPGGFEPRANVPAPRPSAPVAPRQRPEDDLEGTLAMSSSQQSKAAKNSGLPFGAEAAGASPMPEAPGAQAPQADAAQSNTTEIVPPPSEGEPRVIAGPNVAAASQFFHTLKNDPARGPAGALEREPAIPPRRGDVVPIVYDDASITKGSFAAFTMPWQLNPPQDSLTVAVKATFDIDPTGALSLRSEAEPPSGDVFTGENRDKSLLYPSDFTVFKAKADVTLVGRAYASIGAASRSEVRFRFGDPKNRGFERRISVFGERVWQRLGVPTEPIAFDSISLQYESAFGGPGYEANPAGIGYSPKGAAIGDPLPHLESADNLLTKPTDAPPPAGFGPIPIHWRDRWSKMGTFDARWLKERWPYLPEDAEAALFQAAPPGQQLDALDCMESFEIAGARPHSIVLRGALPALRARCFAQRTKEAGFELIEVKLRLDTALFDVEAMKCNLVWRGVFDVAGDDAPDIALLFVLVESATHAPAQLAEVRDRFYATLEREAEAARAAAGEKSGGAAAEERKQVRDEQRVEADRAREDEARLKEQNEKLRADLRKVGVTDAELDAIISGAAGGAAPEKAEPPDTKQMAERMRRAGVPDAEIASMIAEIERASKAAEAPAEPTKPAPEGRARAIAMLAANEPMDDVDLSGADLSELDFKGRSLTRAVLKGCNLSRANLSGADLTMARLTSADLTDASLEGARLIFADLVGSTLRGARLSRAQLDQADMSEAHGERADFRGAKGEAPSFARGQWASASFDEAQIQAADFSGALLDEATFKGATLPQVRLHEARGVGASFDGARIPGARADDACFSQSSFKNADIGASIWSGADLDGSSFHSAILKASNFVRASLEGAILSAADLRDARLDRAKLSGAWLVKSDLMSASLQQADLRSADLRGANLYSCNTWKAVLTGARLEDAIVARSTLKARL